MSSSPTDRAAIVEVTMPQMGVSVAEGTVIVWRKQPGDWVEADETICEISTDKVDTEIPAPASGRLVRILVEENQTVAVGTPIAEMEKGGFAESAPTPNEHMNGGNGATPDRSHVISPVVRRIAAEHGIDLTAVEGTGIGGRIRKKDVLRYIDQASEPVLHSDSPYTQEQVSGETNAVPGGERREPLSVMRQSIAEHMLRSRRTAAHCTTVAEVDMTSVVERRDELKGSLAERGLPLTYLAFVARATVAALRDHPVLNASIDRDELVYHDDVNLGIAVALEEGLIVPVISRAQHLNLEGLASAIADLSARAREKRLSPDEVQGGTFTITNPGQFGTVLATPIINQPQVAILDLESVVKRPVVVETGGAEAIAIRSMTNLCLSFDHRALDGAEAARFLGRIRALLEAPQGSL